MALLPDPDLCQPARLFRGGPAEVPLRRKGDTSRARRARTCLALVAGLAASLLSGCGVPALVEGIVRGEEFVVRDERPASKATASGQDVYLVLAENDGRTLRTVTVRLPRIADLPLDEEIAVGGEGQGDEVEAPVIEVAEGALEVTTRDDGAEILSALDPQFATSTGGSLVLASKDEAVAGTFRIDLDDGGWLDGSFVVRAPAE